ncbi:DUF7344 domain-containing protein [Natrononativus amylolyticus]|uniref:DUF7344 domain-containing protein n=1 Tax=Natrononativus amylolyticus TaxID=2963434 RepID=UPI0020CEE2A7|nr:hypothetical protein [Natrononativus amylolyticus]
MIHTDSDSGPLSLDELFGLLAQRRRRYVLYELRDRDHVDVRELAVAIVARETNDPPDNVPEERIERVSIRLHHNDLPMLHDAKLLEYDERQGDVSASTYFELVEKYLEVAEEDEDGTSLS